MHAYDPTKSPCHPDNQPERETETDVPDVVPERFDTPPAPDPTREPAKPEREKVPA